MNEAGDLEHINKVKKMVGKETRLITCLARWNGKDPRVIVPAALKEGIGLYGFTKPTLQSLLPSITTYMSRPLKEFHGDDLNIAVLARAFHNIPFGASSDKKGKASDEKKK